MKAVLSFLGLSSSAEQEINVRRVSQDDRDLTWLVLTGRVDRWLGEGEVGVILEEGGELGGGGLGDGPGAGQVEREAGHGDGGVGGEADLALLLVVVVQERLRVRREVLQLLVILRTEKKT